MASLSALPRCLMALDPDPRTGLSPILTLTSMTPCIGAIGVKLIGQKQKIHTIPWRNDHGSCSLSEGC
jgi:hypothetical protein